MKFSDLPGRTIQEKLANLPPDKRELLLEGVKRRTQAQAFYCDRGRNCDGMPHEGYQYNHARADQWPPLGVPGVDWRHWIIASGRGAGKTKTGSEYSRRLSRKMRRMGIIAPTAADLRSTIVEGPSGLIRACELAGEPGEYEPSKRRFTFASGAQVLLFSAEEPDRLRGSQVEFWWGDEPAHWAKVEEVWEQINFTLRLGDNPHVLLTTTPLPTKWMKKVMADERSRVVRVSTFANAANLAEDFIATVRAAYEGTRMGRQELYGEILEDVEGALWNMDLFHHEEVERDALTRVVIGVDPAGSTGKKSDETGIVVVGQMGEHLYVLEDATGKYTPQQWANQVDKMAEKWGADVVAVERNFGGDMVKHTLKSIDSLVRIKEVRATRGKRVRAEPIVSLYEQQRVAHFRGLEKLEEELVTWVPDSGMASPNRLDALVWACSELAKPGAATFHSARGLRIPR